MNLPSIYNFHSMKLHSSFMEHSVNGQTIYMDGKNGSSCCLQMGLWVIISSEFGTQFDEGFYLTAYYKSENEKAFGCRGAISIRKATLKVLNIQRNIW